MLSKIAWNAFKKTGNINTFLEFVEENLIEERNGNNKDKSNHFKRK